MLGFAFSVLAQKNPFWGKLGPKNQHCQFKLKRGTCNHFHNILRIFDVLLNFPFTVIARLLVITMV